MLFAYFDLPNLFVQPTRDCTCCCFQTFKDLKLSNPSAAKATKEHKSFFVK